MVILSHRFLSLSLSFSFSPALPISLFSLSLFVFLDYSFSLTSLQRLHRSCSLSYSLQNSLLYMLHSSGQSFLHHSHILYLPHRLPRTHFPYVHIYSSTPLRLSKRYLPPPSLSSSLAIPSYRSQLPFQCMHHILRGFISLNAFLRFRISTSLCFSLPSCGLILYLYVEFGDTKSVPESRRIIKPT